MSVPTPAEVGALTRRFAAFYGALFVTLGIYAPFWPVWLQSRGMNPREIGLLLAVAPVARIASMPLFTYISDRSGRERTTMILLAALALAGFGAFVPAQGFFALLIIQIATAFVYSPLMPLGESRLMRAVYKYDLDYGRVRLWGSLTFILGALGAGAALDSMPADILLWGILLSLTVTLFATFGVPLTLEDSSQTANRQHPSPLLLITPRFLLFLVGAALIQSSHAVVLGFSAIAWQDAGYSSTFVGWLWAVSVVAEILLFYVSRRIIRRFDPLVLLLLGAGAGIVRWFVLGLTLDPILLVAAQTLHAFTFAASHLGAMHYLQRTAPAGLSSTAQGLYYAITGGVCMSGALWLAGLLYGSLGSRAFLAMLPFSIGGLILIWILKRLRSAESQRVP